MKVWNATSKDFVSGALYPNVYYPDLEQTVILRNISQQLKQAPESFGDLAKAIGSLEGRNAENMADLMDMLSARIDHLSSRLEWGVQLLHGDLERQHDLLATIASQQRTESELRAKELLDQAVDLKGLWQERLTSGILGKEDLETQFASAENRFKEALSINCTPSLRYFILVSFAELYLSAGKYDDAMRYLTESVLVSTRNQEGFDYLSQTYRMMARVKFINGDLLSAIELARKAISACPNYPIAYYDLAQYMATAGDVVESLSSLEFAVNADPKFWYLAKHEENFEQIRYDVDALLADRLEGERRKVLQGVYKLESMAGKTMWLKDHLSHNSEFGSVYKPTIAGLVSELGVILGEISTKKKFAEGCGDLLQLMGFQLEDQSSRLKALANQAISLSRAYQQDAGTLLKREEEEESAHRSAVILFIISTTLLIVSAIWVYYTSTYMLDLYAEWAGLGVLLGLLGLAGFLFFGIILLPTRIAYESTRKYDLARSVRWFACRDDYKRVIKELTEWLAGQ